jgi:hypothetical protein
METIKTRSAGSILGLSVGDVMGCLKGTERDVSPLRLFAKGDGSPWLLQWSEGFTEPAWVAKATIFRGSVAPRVAPCHAARRRQCSGRRPSGRRPGGSQALPDVIAG